VTFTDSVISSPRPPAFAARVASVGGSPVRDILAVTARPELVNFAGVRPSHRPRRGRDVGVTCRL